MVIDLAERARPASPDAASPASAGACRETGRSTSAASTTEGPALPARNDDEVMTESAQHPIVIIDDDPNHLALMVTCLERAGLRAAGFTRSREALYHLIDHPAALAVVDLYMPDMDGIEIVRRLHTSVPDLPLIGMTGARDTRSTLYLRSLREFGASTCLRKPIEARSFLAAVRAAMR
jgi:DNA-binding NtrC family response regulator